MANEPVRPRIMDFLEHHDGFAHVGRIARSAQVSRNSVRTVLHELEVAGQLETGRAASAGPDGRRRDNVGYRLRKPK